MNKLQLLVTMLMMISISLIVIIKMIEKVFNTVPNSKKKLQYKCRIHNMYALQKEKIDRYRTISSKEIN